MSSPSKHDKVLVITEKSTQVSALCKFLKCKPDGNNRAKTAEYKGVSVTIFPLSGHILELEALTARDEPIESLPKMPPKGRLIRRVKPFISESDKQDTQKVKAKEAKRSIYNSFKKLVESREFDRIILATDPDLEGCAIGVEVIDEFGSLSSLPVNMMDISNVSPKKLQQEFDKTLFDGKDVVNFRAWALVAHIRADINNRIGIDVSHYMMKKFSSYITFGTQQTRALRLIVERWRKHIQADRSDHYRIRVKTDVGDFLVKLDKDRTSDEVYAREIYDRLATMSSFDVLSLKKKKEIIESPAWMDGSDVGASVSQKLKKNINIFTGKNGVLQSLYEEGKMTYPRTEALGLMPLSQYDEQVEIAKSIADMYSASRLDTSLKKPYMWRRDDEEVNGEIVNHTPYTIAVPDIDFSSLSSDERAVVDLTAKVLLGCFYPDNKVINYEVTGEYDGVMLTHKSSADVDLGWKELYGEEARVSPVPDSLIEGDSISVSDMAIETFKKSPPPLFTKATLMKELKKKKIGAESTFETLIEIILDPKRGYCTLEKGKIVPTKKGLAFLDIVPNQAIDVLSVFEEVVAKRLQDGKMPAEVAFDGRDKIIAETFDMITSHVDSEQALAGKLLSESQKSDGYSIDEIGTCPYCGGEVVDYGEKWKSYVCKNSVSKPQKNSDEETETLCSFRIYKVSDHPDSKFKYSIDQKQAKRLLDTGDAVIDLIWKDTGNESEKTITLVLDDEGEPPSAPRLKFLQNQ